MADQWFVLELPSGGGVWIHQHRSGNWNAVLASMEVAEGIKSVREISKEDIPLDRTFRNALKPDLKHDMPKAREIWRDKMRETRAPKLAALDVEYQRADEVGDMLAKAEVVAQKQALRDVTADPAIEAAQTPEELKAVWPIVLQ